MYNILNSISSVNLYTELQSEDTSKDTFIVFQEK